MKSIEKIGKTVDSATTDALIELGATTDEVTVEVLVKGSKGLFGIGAKPAKVRVTLKSKNVDEIEQELKSEINQVTTLVKEKEVEIEKVSEPLTQSPKEPNSQKHLDDAKQNAETFLNEVLQAMGVEGQFTTKVSKGKLDINITGQKMGIIIGKRGETLDSLQYLTNIVVNKGDNSYVKVMLDTENYRARREETLRKLAQKLAKKATQTRRPVVLEPMNPYDRRIIHSSLQNNKSINTHSEGKEPFRKVVITSTLAKANNKK